MNTLLRLLIKTATPLWYRSKLLVLAIGVLLIYGTGTGCKPDKADNPKVQAVNDGQQPYVLDLPAYFPPAVVPADNPMTVAKVALGRRLFFDPLLSKDSTISCASCHKPEFAFSDAGNAFSKGVKGRLGTRNTPALFNLHFRRHFNWDGGTPTLELQALVPIHAEFEMDMDYAALEQRLRKHPEYPALFQQAYGTDVTLFGITGALASFQRSLISVTSRYDRYLQGDKAALTQAELRGMDIFFSERAECFHCHDAITMNDADFHNNGMGGLSLDRGRAAVTGNEQDHGKFHVPSLRNIALTAPYMHNGSLKDLDAVVDFYMSGGVPSPTRSALIRPFTLSAQEKQDLISFLHALTDEAFVRKHSTK